MKNTITLHLLAFYFSFALSVEENRTDRMFSLFNVVKFTNSPCQAKSSSDLQGICFTDKECSDRGGIEDGNCAAGFGRCCVFRNSVCGATVSENCTYVENPGFPNAYTGTAAGDCAFTVNRMQTDVAQIRLDFTNMAMGNPNAGGGNCDAEMLVIAPGATNLVGAQLVPTLCGVNTGQHVYVDAGTAQAAATLTFTMVAASKATWRVKVSQIASSSMYKAPNGCLQYFMGIKNTVKSFNFGTGTGDCDPNCHLRPQNYNVCFKQEKGMCSMQYVENSGATDAFQLHDIDATTNGALVTADNCENSGVIIPVTMAEFGDTNGVYCGQVLGSVALAVAPNVIPGDAGSFMFRSYSTDTQVTALAGFSIDASQVPCS